MARNFRNSLPRLLHSGFITAGLLLASVGLANCVVGSVKLSQYERLAAKVAATTAPRPALSSGFLFTNVSEAHERQNIAAAKLQYYRVVLTVGQLLVVTGLILILIGYVRLQAPPRVATQNKTLLDIT